MVGHLLQYHGAFIKLKEILAEGKLGKLKYLYSNRLNLGKIYNSKDVLWDLAPHDLSMVLSLTNSEPTSIGYNAGKALEHDVADFSMLNLEFPNNVKAHIFTSWLHPVKEHKLVVVGDQATIIFEDTNQLDTKLALYNHKVTIENGHYNIDKKDAEYITLPASEPLKTECQHFVDCIEKDLTPRTNGFESLKIIKILEQAEASSKNMLENA